MSPIIQQDSFPNNYYSNCNSRGWVAHTDGVITIIGESNAAHDPRSTPDVFPTAERIMREIWCMLWYHTL
eukprot:scaffold4786_cov198-Amphora_coffeaeformis.AAC.2